MIKRYKSKLDQRKARTRMSLKGTSQRPRLSVFRSNKYVYAQVIDDSLGKTLVSSKFPVGLKNAALLGEKIAQECQKKKIKAVVFDRGAYRYHGQVKTIAESARKAGLNC